MTRCIICRQEFNEEKLSDEHVIPDSLGGYYHIYSVCDNCNKNLGTIIDPKLISHKIMELCRFLNGIKSRKGYLPNPFGGIWDAKDNADLKVRIFLNENGDIDYKLVPSGIKKIKENHYRFLVDKRDENIANKIIERFCKKNNIDRNRIEIEKFSEQNKICIECKWEIDTLKFKLGLLKIAYEFATDVLPAYINDKEALNIADILKSGNFNSIENCTRFIGNGVDKKATQCMSFLRNLDNKHHYLMLVSIKNVGLQCYINLFNAMFIGVWLSNKYYDIHGDIIIGVNDIENRTFYKLNIDQYIKENYTRPKIRFYTKNNREITDYFVADNGLIPLYYASGVMATEDFSKVSKKEIKVKDLGDMEEIVKTKVVLKRELYLKNTCNEMFILKHYIVEQIKRIDL